MWHTRVRNEFERPVFVNGQELAGGAEMATDYVLEVVVPGLGSLALIEPDDSYHQRVGTSWAVKLVSGGFVHYLGYEGDPTFDLVITSGGRFTLAGGPTDVPISSGLEIADLGVNERHVVEAAKAAPKSTDERYLTVTSKTGKIVLLNGEFRHARTVAIVGVHLVFEAGNDNRLFERFADRPGAERGDLERLTVFADVIEVRSPVRFAQTHVTLMARELRFTRDGALDTTPLPWRLPVHPLQAGVDGVAGGNIDLYVERVLAPPSETPRIRMNGSQGQPGGDGRAPDGAPWSMPRFDVTRSATWLAQWWVPQYRIDEYEGQFISREQMEQLRSAVYVSYHEADWNDDDSFTERASFRTHNKSLEGRETSGQMAYPEEEFGEHAWPDDGLAALPAGRPGDGGPGGTLRTNLPAVGVSIEQRGGEPGPPGAAGVGRLPGEPNNPVHAQLFFGKSGLKTRLWTRIYASRTLVRGGSPPPPTGEPGKPGETRLHDQSESGTWVHSHTLRTVCRHAADLFLAGRRREAQILIEPYVVELRRVGGSLGRDSQESMALQSLHADLLKLAARLNSSLDYFGNPAGWVPKLAFSALLKSYETEIGRSLRMWYVAYWIQKRWDAVTLNLEMLEEAMQQLRIEVDAAVEVIAGTQKDLLELDGRMSDLSARIEAGRVRLRQIDDGIQETVAMQEGVKRGLRMGVGVLAVVLKLVPAYQPALGAAGDAASVLAKIDPEDPFQAAQDLGAVFSTYTAKRLSERAAKLTEAAAEPETKKATEAKELAAKLAVVSERLGPGVHDVLESLQQLRAPKDALDAAVDRVRGLDPRFQTACETLLELTSVKAGVVEEVTAALDTIGTAYGAIAVGLEAIDRLGGHRDPLLAALDPAVLGVARAMEQQAASRLIEDRYLMAKAYEHLLVRPCPVDFGLESWLGRIERLLETERDGMLTKDEFGELRAAHDAELGTIVKTIRDELDRSTDWESGEHTYRLTPAELATLNRKKVLSLDLMEKGLLPHRQEDIRLVRFGVLESKRGARGIETSGAGKGHLSLTFRLGTVGTVRKGGYLYAFRYNDVTGIPRWTWQSEYELSERSLTNLEPSVSEQSLIGVLTKDDRERSDKFANYARPAAWTTIQIVLERVVEEPVDLTRLTLAFRLSYTNAPPEQRVLDVRSEGAGSPSIRCAPTDLNGWGTGVAPFVRLFERGRQPVLTAPEVPGARFVEWRSKSDGRERSVSSKLQVVVSMEDDVRVWPVYQPVPSEDAPL